MSLKTVKTIVGGLSILLLGVAVVLVSCNDDSGNNPVAPQDNGDAANFYAIEESSCAKPYGAYYQEEDGEFSLKICEPGDYQIEYETDAGITYYLWVRVQQSAILRLGLYSPGDEPVALGHVCVRKGAITLEDGEMNVSGPVRYYPTGGVAIPTNPSIFESDGSAAVCPIVDGEVNESNLVEQLPEPVRTAPTGGNDGGGGGGGGGTTPYTITVNFTGSCATNVTVNCTATSGCTPASLTGTGAGATTGTFDVISGTATLSVTGGCGAATVTPSMFTASGIATVLDNLQPLCGFNTIAIYYSGIAGNGNFGYAAAQTACTNNKPSNYVNAAPFLSRSTQNISSIVEGIVGTYTVYGILGGACSSFGQTWNSLWTNLSSQLGNHITFSVSPAAWWSGSNSNGTAASETCSDWEAASTGRFGMSNTTTATWIQSASAVACGGTANADVLCVAW